jgi:hypothetical protein
MHSPYLRNSVAAIGLAAAFVAFAASALSANEAFAQGGPTIAVGPQVFRENPDGSVAAQRPQQFRPEGFNYADCRSDIRIRLSVTMTNVSQSANPEVWAGQNCADNNARLGNTPTCWRVIDGPLARVQSQDVRIRVQDLLAGQALVRERANQGDRAGAIGYPAGTEAACETQPTPGEQSIPIWFFWVGGSNEVIAQSPQNFTAVVDVEGPPAPTLGPAAVGEVVTLPLRVPEGVTDVQQYVAYCNPIPGQEGSRDAGPGAIDTIVREVCEDLPTPGGGDAGASNDASGGDDAGDAGDAGEETPAPAPTADAGRVCRTERVPVTCNQDPFVGQDGKPLPRADERYRCGEVGGAAVQSISIRGLRTGTPYAVTVAGVDNFGNTGPLAVATCVRPQDTQDFWERYKAAGGDGGGQCALEAVGLPTGSSLAALASGALVLGWIRRRRRS